MVESEQEAIVKAIIDCEVFVFMVVDQYGFTSQRTSGVWDDLGGLVLTDNLLQRHYRKLLAVDQVRPAPNHRTCCQENSENFIAVLYLS